jgi:hypothetical protein
MIREATSPVLLIVFNRPSTTHNVFEAIRKAKPTKLYIFADGPRFGNIEDTYKCDLVKEIVKNVDWNCEVHYRFVEVNQGCGLGPYNAISWVFEIEDRAIILEDDCIPALPFFEYCDELLERYKDDTRIWLISGNQYNEEAVSTPHSYFFSKYGHSWGWATWRRCWKEMDMEMKNLPLVLKQDLFRSIFRTKREVAFFKKKYQRILNDKSQLKHTWDIQFGFALAINSHICVVPTKNLVKNIGYYGTHSNGINNHHDRPIDENYKIVSHPDFVLVDVNYDDYHFRHHWDTRASLFRRITRKIGKLINMSNSLIMKKQQKSF